MDYNSLLNKWLFVAYSKQKEGTEDDSFDIEIIYMRRPLLVLKNGRFDRLGKTYT